MLQKTVYLFVARGGESFGLLENRPFGGCCDSTVVG